MADRLNGRKVAILAADMVERVELEEPRKALEREGAQTEVLSSPWPTLQTDIRNAGGEWTDEEVVVDRNLVTSRMPDDIPAFSREMVELFAGVRAGAPRSAPGAPPRATSARRGAPRRPPGAT
jgi:protease I